MKHLSLLGSTGSIGTQTLDVVRGLRDTEDACRVEALAARYNVELLEAQIREFRPRAAAVFSEDRARDLRARVRDLDVKILAGMEGLCEAASFVSADLVLNAVVGMVGLRPTLAAIEAGKTLALANKETLVAGGSLVMAAARKHGVAVLPVDSEHSAVFQCLQGAPGGSEKPEAVKKLILTASGGPFFGKTKEELAAVTPAQALKHPNWSMGAKVTVDSATMMNKGLEVIEACWLFGLPPERIDVVVHRESIVHSLVEYEDHSVIAQLGLADMRIPIQYALTWPRRHPSPVGELELGSLGSLHFAPPDRETFRCLPLCVEAMKRGGLAPAAVNAANEAAVEAFLAGRVGFLQISELAAAALEHQRQAPADSLEAVMEADREARVFTANAIERI